MDKRVTCTLIVPLLLTIQAISPQYVRAEETSAKPTAAAPTKAPKYCWGQVSGGARLLPV